MDTARITALYRYPVKGLSPEPLATAALEAGGYFPGDRLFAIENGPSGFDAAAPVHQPKIKYLMLMKNEALARLSTRYDPATHLLTIDQDGQRAIGVDVRSAKGVAALAAFFAAYLPGALRGPAKLLAAPDGYRFTDSRRGHVSLINLASVRAIEDWAGVPIDPLRFRGNVYVEGWPAFAELDLVDRTLALPSGARLTVVARTDRCAATNVDPQTGVRDLALPALLMQRLGHMDCGVYARIEAGGALAVGDALAVAS